MSSSWLSLQLAETPLMRSLREASQAVLPVLDLAKTIAELTKTVAEASMNLLVYLEDANTTAIKIAVEAARAILKDLDGAASIYALPVPIKRIDTTPAEQILFREYPGEDLDYTEIATATNLQGSGGNYGFLQTIVESLNDDRDLYRPSFDQNAYIAGVVIVYGSSDYAQIMNLIAKLKLLFSKSPGTTALVNNLVGVNWYPQISNLNAKIIATSDIGIFNYRYRNKATENNEYAVLLKWDNPPGPSKQYITQIQKTVSIEKIELYRSVTPITDIDSDGEKIGEFEYDEYTDHYLDQNVMPGNEYFYAVNMVVDGVGTPSFTAISLPEDMTELFPSEGVPPDWLKLPSPTRLIPGVTAFIQNANVVLDTLESKTESNAKAMRRYLDVLQKEIDKYDNWFNALNDTITQLVRATDWPDVYVGITSFDTQGGNNALVNAIGTALNSHSNAPPFTKGTEFTGGLVIMGGAENPAGLTTVKSLLSLLLGLDFELNQFSSALTNTYEDVLDAVGEAIDEVDAQISFLDDFTVTEDNASTDTPSTVTGGFNKQMQPAKGDTTCTGD